MHFSFLGVIVARTDLQELMYQYALKGIQDWKNSEIRKAKSSVQKLLNARIVETDFEASRAVDPVKHKGHEELVPMPKLTTDSIEWAFFTPRREVDDHDGEWMFDLVLLLPDHQPPDSQPPDSQPPDSQPPDSRHICFRLEPADQLEGTRHGYSHMQLSWRFHGKQTEPEKPLKWLPDSYPAFPIPGKCSLDRFLMLVVALHGFPSCTQTLLRYLKRERPVKAREFLKRVRVLLYPT